jgi:subtilase family serine protease
MNPRWLLGPGLLLLVAVVAIGVAKSSAPHRYGVALASSRPIGSVAKSTRLRLELGLADRRSAALDRLIASGRTVSAQRFDRMFLPSAKAVSRAMSALAAAGLRPSWTPGSGVVQVDGAAGAVEQAFGVQLERYRQPGGSTYYAPVSPPHLTPPVQAVVSNVSGLDDRGRVHDLGSTSSTSSGCGSTAGGYSPAQVMSAYDFDPLLHESLNGSGQTVVFLEIDTFQQPDLDCLASKYGESPPNVSVVQGKWGSPSNSANSGSGESEAELDLEIVHSIAPAARLVVYYADARPSDIAAAAQAAVAAHPKAIFSVSIGGCEVESLSNGQPVIGSDETMWDSALKRLAATGGSAFIASGDSGAYTCGKQLTDGQTGAELPSVSSPASDPYATSVGGTTLFASPSGSYQGEAAWGSPFEGDGSGGGVSYLWRRPSWQTGQGTSNSYSDGEREVPDVSALGDPNTGWAIYVVGNWSLVAGTSAAAPLWASLTALADQKLAQQSLPAVGFANLPIYAFGGDPSKWPAKAFNDVTNGENLYYSATRGWDPATGWGSPNAAGFVQDLLTYEKAAH